MRLIGLAALWAAGAAGADPSTFAESAAKIRAILDDPVVAAAVHQAPMAKVEEIGIAPDGADLWQVMVQDCDLTLRLLPTPEGWQVELADPCS